MAEAVSKAHVEATRLARRHKGLEELVANLGSDPWPRIANLNQNGVAFRNCRDSNGSSAGHEIEHIYEQVDENPLDALTVGLVVRKVSS